MNRRGFLKGVLTVPALLDLDWVPVTEASFALPAFSDPPNIRRIERWLTVSGERAAAVWPRLRSAQGMINARPIWLPDCGWVSIGRALLGQFQALRYVDQFGVGWEIRLTYLAIDAPSWNHIQDASGRWRQITPEPYAYSEDLYL